MAPSAITSHVNIADHTIHRWTIGSVLFLASWAVLMGPLTYLQHLISTPRLPFTAAYFGAIALTLYFALGVSHPFLRPFSLPVLSDADQNTIITTASQHSPHPHLLHRPTCRPPLVSRQLLPHGRDGAALRREVWHEQGRGLDDGLVENSNHRNEILHVIIDFKTSKRRRQDVLTLEITRLRDACGYALHDIGPLCALEWISSSCLCLCHITDSPT